jgi:hypothetical protein
MNVLEDVIKQYGFFRMYFETRPFQIWVVSALRKKTCVLRPGHSLASWSIFNRPTAMTSMARKSTGFTSVHLYDVIGAKYSSFQDTGFPEIGDFPTRSAVAQSAKYIIIIIN